MGSDRVNFTVIDDLDTTTIRSSEQVRRIADQLNKYIVDLARKPMEPLNVGDKWSSKCGDIDINYEVTGVNGDEAIITQSFIPPHPVVKLYIDPSTFKKLMGTNRYRIIFAITKDGKVHPSSRNNYMVPVIKRKK